MEASSTSEMEYVDQMVEIRYTCTVTVHTKKFDKEGRIVSESIQEKEVKKEKKFHPRELIVPQKNKLKVKGRFSSQIVPCNPRLRRAKITPIRQ